MSSVKVRSALVLAAASFFSAESIDTDAGLIQGFPTLEPSRIAWENRFFKSADFPLWASVFYIPNIPTPHTVGKGGRDLLSGFIQIDFNIPKDSGEQVHLVWEDKGRTFFRAGEKLVFEGQGVILTETGMSAGRLIEDHYRKSLTVAFRSYLKREPSI
jgi:hypothetical protein